MKTQKFIASDIQSAMQMIRDTLGGNAVILSNTKNPEGKFEIVAATDDDLASSENEQKEVNVEKTFNDSMIRECLNHHDALDETNVKILSCLRNISIEENVFSDKLLLEKTFAKMFKYKNISDPKKPFKMFMGVSGSGKSTAIAKLAMQSKLENIKSCIISTDNVRAGANNQLQAFAKILEVDFYFAKDERALFDLGSQAVKSYGQVLIDTPGINPYIKEETDNLLPFVDVLKSEIVMTMDASKNTKEAVEVADIFYKLGARYLLPTRLDLTRRIGSVLSVADCCNLKLCSASISSNIANSLTEMNNKSLAKMVLSY